MQEPFFKLWRRFRDHRWWRQPRVFSRAEAWIDLMMDAAWESHKRYYKGELYEVGVGEIITSERDLAKHWRWSRGKVRRFLADAQVNGEAAHRQYQHATRITVLGLSRYGVARPSGSTSNSTSDGPATDQRRTTIEEGKEGKEELTAVGDDGAKLYHVFQCVTGRLPKGPRPNERTLVVELCVEVKNACGSWEDLGRAVKATVAKASGPVHSIRYCEQAMRERIHELRKSAEPMPEVTALLAESAAHKSEGTPASHIQYKRKPTDNADIEGMERGLESIGSIISGLGTRSSTTEDDGDETLDH